MQQPATLDVVNPLRRRIIEDTVEAILDEYDFQEDRTIVMDFACGSGLISQQLAPYCNEIVGVDSNEDMVALFNKTVSDQGIEPAEMRAISSEGALDGKKFDVVVCAQAYHHFESIEDVTKGLASHLAPQGVLLVVDHIRPTDHDPDVLLPEHGNSRVVHPGGFSEAEIRTAFDGAGLQNFTFRSFTEFAKRGKKLEMFIAKGAKV